MSSNIIHLKCNYCFSFCIVNATIALQEVKTLEYQDEIEKEKQLQQNKFVGKKIRKYRKELKLTQSQLGEKLGVKDNTISAYERGVIEVPYSKLMTAARIFNISYIELLPLEEDGIIKESASEYLAHAKTTLNEDENKFLEDLIKKTLSLENEEREKFLENIRFAVEYFEKDND